MSKECVIKISSHFLRDVRDGKVFRENSLIRNESDSIPLIIYQDAFEVVNPIGSARKKH